MNGSTEVRFRRSRVPAVFATLAAAMLAVSAGVGASLGIASVAGATPPDTPIFDVVGTPDAISLDAPFIYALQDNAVDAPAASWTFLLNDQPGGTNPLGGASTVWASGDVLNIVVAPPVSPGCSSECGINHVESGDSISFATVPFVGIVGTAFPISGVTPPTITVTRTTYAGDSVDSNDAGILDDLAITFTGTPDPAANAAFVVQVGSPSDPVEYNTGPHDPVGAIQTTNSNFSGPGSNATSLAQVDDGPITVSPSPPPSPPTTGGSVSRIAGQDAIGTAIAVSQAEFPTTGTAGAVVLARSDYFSDALCGDPLAAAVNGPLLITPGPAISSTIDAGVLAEIQRVLPAGRTVYILGGDLALSPTVDAQLAFLGYSVKRLSGNDQFATCVAVAQQLGNPAVVFEATGLNFADALSAVPAAVEDGGAILLTNGNVQASETAAYLAAHPADTRYAIGGPEAALGADPTATAVYGQDEFGTSAAVAVRFFANATVFGAATGLNYPDALSGGVYMATGGRMGPMLLVEPTAPLPPSIAAYLATLTSGTQGYVFGGPLAVGDDVEAALGAAVG
jgi:hypothetical protein